jgi:hypothetical protein
MAASHIFPVPWQWRQSAIDAAALVIEHRFEQQMTIAQNALLQSITSPPIDGEQTHP